MNRKTLLLAFMIAAAICGWTVPGHAYGIGGYFGIGGNSTKLSSDYISSDYRGGLIVGGGVVADTCVQGKDFFGYRGHLGLEAAQYGDSTNRMRASLNNTLALGLFSNGTVRFWLGPQLGLHLVRFKGKQQEITTLDYLIWPLLVYKTYQNQTRNSSAHNGGIADLGLALGVNIQVKGNISLIVDTAFKYGVHFANELSKSNSTVHGFEGIVNLGAMMRFSE